MVARKRLKTVETPASDYFPNEAGVACIPTGCSVLDCVLGGGWARSRVINIVGDKSVGKSLLAIEACANFSQLEPEGRIFYRESEAAFDEPYAETVGLPPDRVDFGPDGIGTVWDTIEDIFEDLDARLAECKKDNVPGLYIVDSLDALSSRAELERDLDKGSYSLEKQKMMGKLFRQLIRKIKAADFCIIFISQIRDKIGVTFGEKHTRSGGKALDFYASQILWLSHLGRVTKTSGGVKRAVGVRVKALCKKNKISLPFRECEFEISFGFGTDDIGAGVEWLEQVKAMERFDMTPKQVEAFLVATEKMSGKELTAARAKVREAVFAAWKEVESRFAPSRKKYG